jgi:hypothetical protein
LQNPRPCYFILFFVTSSGIPACLRCMKGLYTITNYACWVGYFIHQLSTLFVPRPVCPDRLPLVHPLV